MVLVMGLSFLVCGSKTKEGVVAEGTGATNWGYDMNLLYQENYAKNYSGTKGE